jgi:hypothetical protein
MALETLKGAEKIGGFDVLHWDSLPSSETPDSMVEKVGKAHIVINHKMNIISFSIQNGPIKEHGVNGCQVDTIIHAAKKILEGLNEKFPSSYNKLAIIGLDQALFSLERRTKDREKRNVEGTSQA